MVVLDIYGGGDHNHKHVLNQLTLIGIFLLGNMDKLNVTRVCPVISFLNTAKRDIDFLNIVISGLPLKSNV